jgi:lysophospholipase L1-like esterase
VPWGKVAADLLGERWQCHNFGIGSASIFDGISRLREHVLGRAFSVLGVQFGVNDLNYGTPAEHVRDGFIAFLRAANLAPLGRLVFVGILPGGDAVGSDLYVQKRALNSWLEGWCLTNLFGYIDAWSIFTDGDPLHPDINPLYSHGDSLHLNNAGQALLGANFRNRVIAYKAGLL